MPPEIEQAGHAMQRWAGEYAQPLLFGAGAIGALVAVVLLWRFLRTGHAHTKLGTAAVTLATLFAMEGMYEVAHGPLGLGPGGSLMFCATFEIVMLHQGTLAAHKLAAPRPAGEPAPNIRRHMTFVWLVAAASGVIASTASSSLTEVVLRLTTPPLAAGIWYMSLYADKPVAARQESNWIWTPQQIGVRIGLLKPGAADDLNKVFREKRAARLVRAAVAVHADQQAAQRRGAVIDTAADERARKNADRLQRLAQTADAATVAEAREQLRITLGIQRELLDGLDRPAGGVDDATRDVLDEVRLITRQASDRVRSKHASAFGAVQSQRALADQVWSNPVVRMPARIADQIRTTPPAPIGPAQSRPAVQSTDQVDAPWLDQILVQPVDQPAAPDVDQARSTTAAPVQPVTSRSIPAARTTSAHRTTVRVDQEADQVPPRVLEMAKALRRKYRGEIPARRIVMPAMRWTNVGDASAAIRLVRAERAERTKTTPDTTQSTDRDAV